MYKAKGFISPLITFLIHPILLSLILISQAALVQAQTVTMIRDYTYNASENDSKVSARKAALEQLQKAAIEEVGVQVESSVVSNKSVVQGQLKQEMLLNYKLFSQALTKTKILEEKWDGESFYLKAEIEVDPNGITSAMKTLSSGSSNIDICTDNLNKVKAIFQQRASVERNQALTDIAMTTEFDTKCNRWQYDILSSLTRSPEYPTEGYRTFLFDQLAILKDYQTRRLSSLAINYAIAYTGALTQTEWDIILNKIHNIRASNISGVIGALSALDAKTYKEKVLEIIEASEDSPLATSAKRKQVLIQKIIKASIGKHSHISAELYLKYAGELKDANNILPIITKLYTTSYTIKNNKKLNSELIELVDEAMFVFFDNNEVEQLDEASRRYLNGLMTPLLNASRRASYDPSKDKKNQYIRDLLQRFPEQFAYIVESTRASQKEKNIFLLKHNLPAVHLCTPTECVKQLFNRKLSTHEQNAYLVYLLAYGTRAKNVEADIVKLLDRANTMVYKGTTHQRKISLMHILVNINTTNPKAIELLIANLTDENSLVVKEAITSLASLELSVFEAIKVRFNELSTSINQNLNELETANRLTEIRINKENKLWLLTQQRILEVITLMSPSKKLLPFLTSIPIPKTLSLKYALEDAIEIHDIAQSN